MRRSIRSQGLWLGAALLPFLSGCACERPRVEFVDDLFSEMRVSGSRGRSYDFVLKAGIRKECAAEEIRAFLARDAGALKALVQRSKDHTRDYWTVFCGLLRGRDMSRFHLETRARKEEITREIVDD